MSNVIRMTPPRSPQIGAGHKLAIEMFEELEEIDDDAERPARGARLEKEYRYGKPYWNIALEYLRRAQAAGPEVEQGFMMILSDIVALNADGFGVESEHYSRMMGQGTIASDQQVIS